MYYFPRGYARVEMSDTHANTSFNNALHDVAVNVTINITTSTSVPAFSPQESPPSVGPLSQFRFFTFSVYILDRIHRYAVSAPMQQLQSLLVVCLIYYVSPSLFSSGREEKDAPDILAHPLEPNVCTCICNVRHYHAVFATPSRNNLALIALPRHPSCVSRPGSMPNLG